MKQIVALLLITCLSNAHGTISKSGTLLITTNESNRPAVLKVLDETKHIDVFHGTPDTLSVHAELSVLNTLMEKLDQFNVQHSIEVDKLKPKSRSSRIETGSFPAGTDLAKFQQARWYPYADIVNFMDAAVAQFPAQVSKTSIGSTHEGRDIFMLKITSAISDSSKDAVLIDAGIHAREWIAPAAALGFVHKLLLGTDDEKRLLDTADVYIIPCLNPDGYVQTWTGADNRYYRKNMSPDRCNDDKECCPGTDLNRQFDYHWGVSGVSSDPCNHNYKGIHAMSEPEAQALSAAAKPIADKLKLYASLHGFGRMILLPYGYAKGAYPGNYDKMQLVAEAGEKAMTAAHGAKYTAMHTSALYPMAGGSHDYMHAALHIPYAYVLELRPTGTTVAAFSPPTWHVPLAADEVMHGISAMWGKARQLQD